MLWEIDDRHTLAATWDSLGYAHHHLGDHERAIECYRRSVDILREVGDRYFEADTLTRLGETHHAAGDVDLARRTWQEALTIFDEIGHPDADDLRKRLESSPAESGGRPSRCGRPAEAARAPGATHHP